MPAEFRVIVVPADSAVSVYETTITSDTELQTLQLQ